MTVFALRTDLGEPLEEDVDVALDWAPGLRAATIHTTARFLADLLPGGVAQEFFLLGAAVYCVDKLAPRADGDAHRDRDLELRVPVAELDRWRRAQPLLERALVYLSGDRWRLVLRRAPSLAEGRARAARPPFDAVCLLSGGLDSLCGAIDLLADGARVVFVGHHDGGAAATAQTRLHAALRDHHGEGRTELRQLHLGPASPHPAQELAPPTFHDPSSRARSLLFIAAGLVVADGIAPDVALHMPENGFIGVNVPLVPARVGWLSTRTTHPQFMATLREALDALGLAHPIVNPFRVSTKGEALAASRDPDLLRELAPRSLSCAHPEAVRWVQETQRNCGYCYPCLIRRAALHANDLDDPDDYVYDILHRPELVFADSDKGADLRALLRHLERPADPLAVLRNAAIPRQEARDFAGVYRRGRDELKRWLVQRDGPVVARRPPA